MTNTQHLTRSEATAQQHKVPKTHAAMLARYTVSVDEATYPSIRQALEANALPLKHLIALRLRLVATSEAVPFNGQLWQAHNK